MDGWPANLCISELLNPWTVARPEPPVIISRPSESWEQYPHGNGTYLATNEGPQQLVNPHSGQSYVVYSASRSDTYEVTEPMK